MYVGKNVLINVPAQVKNGKTLVPLRFVSEALGAKVNWDNGLGIVTISSDNKKIEVTIEQDVWLRNPSLYTDRYDNPIRIGMTSDMVWFLGFTIRDK